MISVLALGLTEACARPSSVGPAVVSRLQGRWRAAHGGGVLELVLTVSGTRVTGTGTVSNPAGASLPVTLSGTFRPPVFALQLRAPGLVTDTLSGRIEADTVLVAVLRQSAGDSIRFIRAAGR
jgi:hypothetical protein